MSYRHDPVYRSVRWLRDRSRKPEGLVAHWAAQTGMEPADIRIRLGLTNYKPFERARVVAEMAPRVGHGRTAAARWLSLHVAATPEEARTELESKSARLSAGAVPPLLFGDHATVAWTLPHAPGLEALAELIEPDRFHTLAARVPGLGAAARARLVRYVPLKRALLVHADPTTGRRHWLKLFNAEDGAGAMLGLREVRAWYEHGAFAARVPRLVHYDTSLHLMVMDEVPGTPFTRLLAGGGRVEPFAELGRALAELHAVPTVPWRAWSFAQEHGGLRRHMRGARRALPALAGRIDRIVDRLGRDMPQGQDGFAPIHGNLFGDQILYDETAAPGRRIGVVDWDAWCHGDPHYDLGRMIAHLVYVARLEGQSTGGMTEAAEALLEGYRMVAGHAAVDRARLTWQLAVALLLRAKISSLRKLVPGWPRHMALMVAEAEDVLDGGGALARPRSVMRPNLAAGELSAP